MKVIKVIKEILHTASLLMVVTVCGLLVYWEEWEIITHYKDVIVLAFILILMVEIIFNEGKRK